MARFWQVKYYGVIPLVFAGLLAVHHVNAAESARGGQYHLAEFKASKKQQPPSRDLARPQNIANLTKQISLVEQHNQVIYGKYNQTYKNVLAWLKAGGHYDNLKKYHLNSHQLAGEDNYGNVLLTGYYSPKIEARRKANKEYRYPLYAFPKDMKRLPTRKEIYQGALKGKGLELAYTRSLFENFMLSVQGSGFIDFGDGKEPTYFAYGGKNGYGYRSIGRILVEQGEVPKNKISIQAIEDWAKKKGEKEMIALFAKNPAFVFYKPLAENHVLGASQVPLLAKTAVATDKKLIPAGSVLLIQMPLLDKQGRFNGQYEVFMALALDVGSAIKGHHIDIYQGIGKAAGNLAGRYNHYGHVWILSSK